MALEKSTRSIIFLIIRKQTFKRRIQIPLFLTDWRTTEVKTKSKCHSVCKENERVQDAVLDCKLGKEFHGPAMFGLYFSAVHVHLYG